MKQPEKIRLNRYEDMMELVDMQDLAATPQCKSERRSVKEQKLNMRA